MIGLRNLLKKILSFALATILVLAIYASQSSNEINSGYFEPYKNKSSTDIMTFSVDNSTYRQGQTIYFSGKVNHLTVMESLMDTLPFLRQFLMVNIL